MSRGGDRWLTPIGDTRRVPTRRARGAATIRLNYGFPLTRPALPVVERYYAGQTATFSWIDLANATVATTIQFSKEANSNLPANDAPDP